MPMLIAARALQGTAGGGMIQLVYVTISDLFSVRKRALYIGWLGFAWAIAGSAGPLLGGVFTQLVSWRWCFWINLPVCGIAFLTLLLFLDVHNPRTRLRQGVSAIDWIGSPSMLAVTLLLLLGLDFGGAIYPWSSPKVICLLVFGTLMIGFFIFNEKRLAKYPLIPLNMFKDWLVNAAFLVAIAHAMVSIGTEYYLPLYFQSVKQTTPLRSGILLLPLVATEATTDPIVGVVIERTGRIRELTWAGVLLMTLGTGLYMLFGSSTSIACIAGFEIVAGVGTAMLFQTPMIAVQNAVTQADTSSATATLGFMLSLSKSASIVLGGVVFQNSMASRHAELAAAGLSEAALVALAGDRAAANVDVVRLIQDIGQRRVAQDAFAWSIKNIFLMYTCVAAVAVVGSLFIKERRLRTEHTETKTGIANLTEREA